MNRRGLGIGAACAAGLLVLVGCASTPAGQVQQSAASAASSLASSASAAQSAGSSAADGVTADLEALALAVDNIFTNSGRYPPFPPVGSTGTVNVGIDVVTLSAGNSISDTTIATDNMPVCFAVTHAADAANPAPITRVWKPGTGGLQPASVTACS